MKSLAVSVLGWVLVPLLAFAQGKVELNTITGVKVNGSTVEITGSKKPNFTTFTMTDPPRLVIDISEAVLSGVPEAMRPTGGIVTGLRSANYGSDSSAIARVLIGYDREVETDIQVNGNVLLVKVLDGSGPLVAQAGNGPTAAETQAGTAQATQENAAGNQAEEDRRARELAAAEEKKRQEGLARAELEAKKLSEVEEKKRREDEARAEAETKKLSEAEEKRRKAEEAEQQRLAAVEEKKRKAEEAEQQRLAIIEERKRKQEEARAAAEAKKQEEAAERQRKAEEAEQQRLATIEEKKRKQEEARAAAETKRQEEAAERKRKAEEARQQRLALLEEKRRKQEEARAADGTRVARAEVPRRGEPEGTSPASVSERRKTLEIVGFQQQAGGARVYVRTNEPVSYKVSEGRNEIVLMLENTQIGKGNNTRALDTSFFDTAVARVDPAVGPDRSVRVSIKLKERVPVQTRQEGNTISLEFPRPGR
jgi:colicin import membrane protein